MANDRDEKYESHEEGEGEYHFSDDQSTYELEPEAESLEAPKMVAPMGAKEKLIEKLNQHRRIIIGVVVFVVLLLVVYFMVMPASTPPATDFAAGKPTTTPTTKQMQAQTPAAPAPAQQAPAPAPVSTTVPLQQPNPVSMPENVPTTTSSAPAQQPSEAAFPMAPGPVMMPPSQQPAPSTGSVMDRLTALEQQNAKLISLQADYTQKMANYEQQNRELQAKVAQMSTQLGNIEASLNQVSQVVVNKSQGPMPTSSQMTSQMPTQMSNPMGNVPAGIIQAPPVKAQGPRMAYTVQAIIPGRAWLKSDSGDTVTVAEGDILRDYGRISKIDPYDGIVSIDTGSKIITLSYGSGSDE